MLLDPRLVLPPNLPSLRFGTATSDRIDCGNPAILTDVPTATICTWVYNTATATNQRLWSKGIIANLHHLRLQSSAFSIVILRPTPLVATSAASNFAAYALNRWIFVVAQYNTVGSATDQKLYIGDEHSAPAEPSSYSAQTEGSGTVATDAGANFCIGNVAASTTVSWVGSYAFFGMWPRLLSYAEIVQQWSQFLNPSAVIDTMDAISYVFPQAGPTALDYSGYGNHGLVTGAVPSGVASPFQLVKVA